MTNQAPSSAGVQVFWQTIQYFIGLKKKLAHTYILVAEHQIANLMGGGDARQRARQNILGMHVSISSMPWRRMNSVGFLRQVR